MTEKRHTVHTYIYGMAWHEFYPRTVFSSSFLPIYDFENIRTNCLFRALLQPLLFPERHYIVDTQVNLTKLLYHSYTNNPPILYENHCSHIAFIFMVSLSYLWKFSIKLCVSSNAWNVIKLWRWRCRRRRHRLFRIVADTTVRMEMVRWIWKMGETKRQNFHWI